MLDWQPLLPRNKMDSQEFIRIYLPLNESLYRVAHYILESQADAEDAVQDLYIKLWNGRAALDEVKAPKAYCISMLKNLCIDRIRKTSKAVAVPLQDGIAEAQTPDNELSDKERLRNLSKAIEMLPEEQRKVLRMKAFDGLSNEEIAVKTGKSTLNVRVLLSQARHRLKKMSKFLIV